MGDWTRLQNAKGVVKNGSILGAWRLIQKGTAIRIFGEVGEVVFIFWVMLSSFFPMDLCSARSTVGNMSRFISSFFFSSPLKIGEVSFSEEKSQKDNGFDR